MVYISRTLKFFFLIVLSKKTTQSKFLKLKKIKHSSTVVDVNRFGCFEFDL